MDQTLAFEAERPRLVRVAARILNDNVEAEDVVQQAWLRLRSTETEIANLGGWLTTVTTRLCLDRLRAKVPTPADELELFEHVPDPAEEIALADTVGIALQVVLDRLSPGERVAFVLHDSFGFDFTTVAALLGTSPTAARKLASRARAKVTQPAAEDALADWQIVDAFMAAAREGDFSRLLELLAPDVVVDGDAAAAAMGTPTLSGRDEVATFFNGAAQAAFSAFVEDRPGAAWMQRGKPQVAFDFSIVDGRVAAIRFRAEPELLAAVRLRKNSM
ncbi:sigma-70 family RNA polymerase sigma factor [Nocardioides sp. Bht2]|uniref:sigma-70 family RNA polymerase sigma factor n=1 Tax=Nocardioides sp. Bht2 TaxID=3392297 RepID=UPI0039B542CB